MGKHQKSWSQEEKLTIVNYYKEHGAAKTSKSMFWKLIWQPIEQYGCIGNL